MTNTRVIAMLFVVLAALNLFLAHDVTSCNVFVVGSVVLNAIAEAYERLGGKNG